MAWAGDRFFPLPSTRPPPSDRREAMSRVSRRFGRGAAGTCSLAWGAWVRAPLRGANQRGSGTGMAPSAGLPACIPTVERALQIPVARRFGEPFWRAGRGRPIEHGVQRARPIDKSSGASVWHGRSWRDDGRPNGTPARAISALHAFFLLSPTTLAMKGPYPEIQGGGSLILAWQIRNKRVLVVGGGEVSPAS
jgi:hypothetical protein